VAVGLESGIAWFECTTGESWLTFKLELKGLYPATSGAEPPLSEEHGAVSPEW